MARWSGIALVLLGCAGIVVVAYVLCADRAPEAEAELLAGTPNLLGAAIFAFVAADVAGAFLVAWSTRPSVLGLPSRPGWATLVLAMAVLLPLSVSLWFGVLCRMLR